MRSFIKREASFLTILILTLLTMNQSNNVFNFKIGLQKGLIELREILEIEKEENERLKKILSDYSKDIEKEEKIDPVDILNKDVPKAKQITNLSKYLTQVEVDNINSISYLKDVLESEQIQLKNLFEIDSEITSNVDLMKMFNQRYLTVNTVIRDFMSQLQKEEGYDKYVEKSYAVEHDEGLLMESLKNLKILTNYLSFLNGENIFQEIDW